MEEKGKNEEKVRKEHFHEVALGYYLNNIFNGVKIKWQYPLKVNNKNLKVDYFFELTGIDGNTILVAVEYHGEQHFRFSNGWHKTLKRFEDSKNRDKCKKEELFKMEAIYIEIDYRTKIKDFGKAIYKYQSQFLEKGYELSKKKINSIKVSDFYKYFNKRKKNREYNKEFVRMLDDLVDNKSEEFKKQGLDYNYPLKIHPDDRQYKDIDYKYKVVDNVNKVVYKMRVDIIKKWKGGKPIIMMKKKELLKMIDEINKIFNFDWKLNGPKNFKYFVTDDNKYVSNLNNMLNNKHEFTSGTLVNFLNEVKNGVANYKVECLLRLNYDVLLNEVRKINFGWELKEVKKNLYMIIEGEKAIRNLNNKTSGKKYLFTSGTLLKFLKDVGNNNANYKTECLQKQYGKEDLIKMVKAVNSCWNIKFYGCKSGAYAIIYEGKVVKNLKSKRKINHIFSSGDLVDFLNDVKNNCSEYEYAYSERQLEKDDLCKMVNQFNSNWELKLCQYKDACRYRIFENGKAVTNWFSSKKSVVEFLECYL